MKPLNRTWTAIAIAVSVLNAHEVFGQACYESSIMSPTPFMGNDGEIFRLDDGSVWEVKFEYEYLYEYYPEVVICPQNGILVVNGKSLNVVPIAVSRPRAPTQPENSPTQNAYLDDEFSFFDSTGRAAAYIEPSDDMTFYLWTGEPVAYLHVKSIFGFNGKHLGWYQNRLIYDHDGGVVAAPARVFRESVDAPPPRSLKQLKPLKGLKELKPLKPLFGRSWSKIPAIAFFLQGAQ